MEAQVKSATSELVNNIAVGIAWSVAGARGLGLEAGLWVDTMLSAVHNDTFL